MRKKHGPHQAELVGNEGLCNQEDGINQQDPAAKRKQAEVARGEGASCHLQV